MASSSSYPSFLLTLHSMIMMLRHASFVVDYFVKLVKPLPSNLKLHSNLQLFLSSTSSRSSSPQYTYYFVHHKMRALATNETFSNLTYKYFRSIKPPMLFAALRMLRITMYNLFSICTYNVQNGKRE